MLSCLNVVLEFLFFDFIPIAEKYNSSVHHFVFNSKCFTAFPKNPIKFWRLDANSDANFFCPYSCSIETVEDMIKMGVYVNDLNLHDSSRELILAGTQQSAELQLALDQVMKNL